MKWWGLVALFLGRTLVAAQPPSGADIAASLDHISLDKDQIYRVRELELNRGGVKLYLTEGVLAFAAPIAGRSVAAIFTTQGVEAGDAEILALPPQRSERISLAFFTKSPNLDEHFSTAVFLFSDDSAHELLSQIQSRPIHKAPELADELAPVVEPVLRQVAETNKVELVAATLDQHAPDEGFFYGLVAGRSLGHFDVLYQPVQFEPVSIGKSVPSANGTRWELWASFRPPNAPAYQRQSARLTDYRIDTTIHPDLGLAADAKFRFTARPDNGRVIPLEISDKLDIASATVDGQPVEVFSVASRQLAANIESGHKFLLILPTPLVAESLHEIEVRYSGSVIRRAPDNTYFVDERNAWFPFADPTLATFDLTFHVPANLQLVATGEPVSDELRGNERVIHRRTSIAEAFAGFNLGDYSVSVEDRGPYHVEAYANRAAISEREAPATDIVTQTASILDYYTARWKKLPIHNIAVTPIAGYFGQGFPGLIYLSSVSYIKERERPAAIRSARMDAFFSELLLPHEVAHQWWGNGVVAANYRAGWIVEAMANDSALEYLENSHPEETRQILDQYRQDLLTQRDGKTIEATGPVDFGIRLAESADTSTWHTITYEKGSWIFRMLRARLGDAAFHDLQMRLLQDFAAQPITNDDLQKEASRFVPAHTPDASLASFFDTWVYGTGIPKLSLSRARNSLTLRVDKVDEDFTVNVPLECTGPAGKHTVRWVRATAGDNDVPIRPGEASCQLPNPTDFLYSQ